MEPGQSGTFQATWEYLTQEPIVPGVKDHCLVEVQHMIIGIRGAVVHRKRWNEKSARRLIIQNKLAQGGRQHVVWSPDRGVKCCIQWGRYPERLSLRWKLGEHTPKPGRYVFRGQFRTGPISAGLSPHSTALTANRPTGLARWSLSGFGFRVVLR